MGSSCSDVYYKDPWDGRYDCDTSGRIDCDTSSRRSDTVYKKVVSRGRDEYKEVKKETRPNTTIWLAEYKVFHFLKKEYKGRRYRAYVKTLDKPKVGSMGIVSHTLNSNFNNTYEVVHIVNCYKALPGMEFDEVKANLISYKDHYKGLIEGEDRGTIATLEEHGIPHIDIEGVRYVVRDLGKTKGDDDMILDTNSVKDEVESTMLDNMFRKVDNVIMDISTGSLGMKVEGSAYTFNDNKLKENPIKAFSMPFPAFAMSTPLDQVKVGDMIVNKQGKATGWITEMLLDGGYKVQNAEGAVINFSPVTNTFMGGESVMVIKNMFGDETFGGIQGPLMAMQMFGGGKDMEGMFKLLMFQNSGMFNMMGVGGDNQFSQMLPNLMLLKAFM